jgi:hypothetical protein
MSGFNVAAGVISAAISGTVSILACFLIEKFGGVVGGSIAMMPHAAGRSVLRA